jgi:capsule polysaccharide export protein KpsE/RkpR
VLPKAFLVEDMGREMGLIQAALADVRKRLAVTQRQIETQKRATEALRKRLDRQRDRMAHQLKDLASR